MTQEEIQEYIKKSPYSLTVKEWNHIKRELDRILPDDFELDLKKDGDCIQGDIYVPVEYLDIQRGILDRLARNWRRTPFNEDVEGFKRDTHDLIKKHQKCYSERDLQSDYYGSYRFTNLIQFREQREGSERLDKAVERLSENPRTSDSSFFHEDWNEIAREYGLPTL